MFPFCKGYCERRVTCDELNDTWSLNRKKEWTQTFKSIEINNFSNSYSRTNKDLTPHCTYMLSNSTNLSAISWTVLQYSKWYWFNWVSQGTRYWLEQERSCPIPLKILCSKARYKYQRLSVNLQTFHEDL